MPARDVTALLHAWNEGDLDAREQVMALVYEELRRRAGTPQLFFVSTRGINGAHDIYASELLSDGTFGAPLLVAELNSPQPQPGVSVRFDGLEGVPLLGETGGTGRRADLYVTTRLKR